jgi:trigger factor
MRKLVEAHQFEVPETLVEHQTQHRLQTLMREMMGQGVDPRQTEINWEGVKEEMRAQAADDVRGSMLLEHIAERENLAVTDEEIEEEINRIAQASRQAVEQVRAALTKQGGTTSIADRLRNRKALDLLIENARVTDEEWREEEEAGLTEEAGAAGTAETVATEEPKTEPTGEDEAETKAESSSPGA